MRTTGWAIAVAVTMLIGCGPKSDSGVNVKAPGVEVEVKPGEGVSVETPAADVDAKRTKDGGEVSVDTGDSK